LFNLDIFPNSELKNSGETLIMKKIDYSHAVATPSHPDHEIATEYKNDPSKKGLALYCFGVLILTPDKLTCFDPRKEAIRGTFNGKNLFFVNENGEDRLKIVKVGPKDGVTLRNWETTRPDLKGCFFGANFERAEVS
jgi:hypothetical protein